MKKGITLLALLCWGMACCLQLSAQNKPTELHFWRKAPQFEQVTLFWKDKSNNETGFEVQQKQEGGNWTTIKTTNANVKKYTFNVNGNWTYQWRVRAKTNNSSSAWSNVVKGIGKAANFVVYAEVPKIENPGTANISGKTVQKIQWQTPAQTGKGRVTRRSRFYEVTVRKASGGTFVKTPTYETRPQVRDNRVQNDPYHSGVGHSTYSYGKYGPNSTVAGSKMHTHHWTNFDAEVDVLVRIKLLNGAPSTNIILNQTKIFPAPLSQRIVGNTLELKLKKSTNGRTNTYMVVFNRTAWQTTRGSGTYEHPLMIFVNPTAPTPGSAPNGKIKNFDNGKLKVFGGGIHMPNDSWRFYGTGENTKTREVYVPGNAYLHGGFYFNNLTGNVKVAGRGIYSDELFKIYGNDRNNTNRTPFANTPPVGGNTWNKNGFWDCKVGVEKTNGKKVTFAGLTSIGGRMGVVTFSNGKLDLINHKDVGYGGGVYQAGVGNTSQTLYKACFIANDDDITYCHQKYDMNYCTTRNYYNGPSFQFGWQVNANNAQAKVNQHTVFPSDRPSNGSFGRNHGVFNSRLQAGELDNHEGGLYQNMTFWGKDNIWFHIGIWNDRGPANPPNGKTSIFGDKTFKNITIKNAGVKKNVLRTMIDPGTNQKAYIRFLHFDNFKIGNNVLNSLTDGNHWQYNGNFSENNFNGTQVNTITFFTPQNAAPMPPRGDAPIGAVISFWSEHNNTFVQTDPDMPEVCLSPLCANVSSISDAEDFEMPETGKFEILDAGNGFIALRAHNGYLVKADPKRYGYVYTMPDPWRGDTDTKEITDEAKFVWHDLGNGQFALWSYALKRYVRRENNTGPDNPLYAASGSPEPRAVFGYQTIGSVSENSQRQLEVFPNPADHTLNILGLNEGQVVSVQVYNMLGEQVLTGLIEKELDIASLSPGVYTLRIAGGNTLKFVKR